MPLACVESNLVIWLLVCDMPGPTMVKILNCECTTNVGLMIACCIGRSNTYEINGQRDSLGMLCIYVTTLPIL